MSYKPEESKLAAYLYGELSEEERKKVEAYLSENDEAREELQQMKEAQSILGKFSEQEVEIPTFTFDKSPKIVVAQQSVFTNVWRKSLAIAASISIIILAGYLMKTNVSVGSDGVQLSFGSQESIEGFSQDQVQAMIEDALAKNNQLVEDQINDVAQELKQFASTNQKAIDQDEIETFMASLNERNIEVLSGLLESSELNQRKYTQDLLQEFALYVDLKRQDDLNVIQTRLDQMANEASTFQTNRLMTDRSDDNQPLNQY